MPFILRSQFFTTCEFWAQLEPFGRGSAATGRIVSKYLHSHLQQIRYIFHTWSSRQVSTNNKTRRRDKSQPVKNKKGRISDLFYV